VDYLPCHQVILPKKGKKQGRPQKQELWSSASSNFSKLNRFNFDSASNSWMGHL